MKSRRPSSSDAARFCVVTDEEVRCASFYEIAIGPLSEDPERHVPRLTWLSLESAGPARAARHARFRDVFSRLPFSSHFFEHVFDLSKMTSFVQPDEDEPLSERDRAEDRMRARSGSDVRPREPRTKSQQRGS